MICGGGTKSRRGLWGLMTDNLSVALVEEDEIAALVSGRDRWIVCFDEPAIVAGLIDSLDDAVAVYPTSPTVMFPIATTFVRKQDFSAERMAKWLHEVTETAATLDGERDFILITNSPAWVVMVSNFYGELTKRVRERSQ